MPRSLFGLRSTSEMANAGTPPGCVACFSDDPVVSLRSTTGYALGSLRLPRRPENDKKADSIVGLPGLGNCLARC